MQRFSEEILGNVFLMMFRQCIFSVGYCLGNALLNVVIGKSNTYLHVVCLFRQNLFTCYVIRSVIGSR